MWQDKEGLKEKCIRQALDCLRVRVHEIVELTQTLHNAIP